MLESELTVKKPILELKEKAQTYIQKIQSQKLLVIRIRR